MRAALLHAMPGELNIEDVEIAAPGPREVVVRTAAAGLCHSDYLLMEGRLVMPMSPIVLGHESAGVVEAVGSAVTYVQPGDHVVTCLSAFCGECEYCLGGRPSLCSPGVGARAPQEGPRLTQGETHVHQFANLGSFAEQLLVHEHAVVKIDPAMPLDRAALLGCGVMTGVGAVFRTARVQPGSTVAVLGCGGVGLNCVQGAALAGASRIIAIDTNPLKLKMAEQFGATDLVDASEGDPVQQVRALLPAPGYNPGGVDYSFEAIGSPATVTQAYDMLRWGGTATVIGFLNFGEKVSISGSDLLMEKRLQGSMMGSNRFRQDMPRFVEMYLQGRLKLDELVSARIGLDEVNEGFAAMARGETARSVIVFD